MLTSESDAASNNAPRGRVRRSGNLDLRRKASSASFKQKKCSSLPPCAHSPNAPKRKTRNAPASLCLWGVGVYMCDVCGCGCVHARALMHTRYRMHVFFVGLLCRSLYRPLLPCDFVALMVSAAAAADCNHHVWTNQSTTKRLGSTARATMRSTQGLSCSRTQDNWP